jgi:hypothetical protein
MQERIDIGDRRERLDVLERGQQQRKQDVSVGFHALTESLQENFHETKATNDGLATTRQELAVLRTEHGELLRQIRAKLQ